MKRSLQIVLFCLLTTSSYCQDIEEKTVTPMGGSVRLGGCGEADFSHICVAGEFAASGLFSTGVYSGNFGYLSETDTFNAPCATETVAEIVYSSNRISVFPNPNSGNFSVRIEAVQNHNASLRLTDLLGRELELRDVALTAGDNMFEYLTFAPGVYFLTYMSVQSRATIKVVVE
ncbi:MAG: T9SS type A sorting domain-containing protein [Taibaiella sp.]|nr:T9SS type A sorting domain-containing protein [Taibaiella sp.]